MVEHSVDVGPSLELALPVVYGAERGDHQERALGAVVAHVRQKSDRLDRLAKTHLVCKDAVTTEKQNGKTVRNATPRHATRKSQTVTNRRSSTETPLALNWEQIGGKSPAGWMESVISARFRSFIQNKRFRFIEIHGFIENTRKIHISLSRELANPWPPDSRAGYSCRG